MYVCSNLLSDSCNKFQLSVEAGHHIATLFKNMALPLPLLRVRYHPPSNDLSVTLLFFICIACGLLYLDFLNSNFNYLSI